MLGFCWNIPPLASINSDILALLFRLLETSAFWVALGFSSVYPTLPKVNILLTRCGDVKLNHLWASYCLQCMMYVQTSTHDIIRSISPRGIISSWLSVLNTDWVSRRKNTPCRHLGALAFFFRKQNEPSNIWNLSLWLCFGAFCSWAAEASAFLMLSPLLCQPWTFILPGQGWMTLVAKLPPISTMENSWLLSPWFTKIQNSLQYAPPNAFLKLPSHVRFWLWNVSEAKYSYA